MTNIYSALVIVDTLLLFVFVVGGGLAASVGWCWLRAILAERADQDAEINRRLTEAVARKAGLV